MSTTTRVFSADDQLAFARLSGDYNPIHLDPVTARRLLFGQPVVHGMHALFWAFDGWLAETNAPLRIKNLRVRFRSSIPLHVGVELVARLKTATDIQLELLVDESKVLTASVSFELNSATGTPIPCELPVEQPCRIRGALELQSAAGELPLCLESDAAAQLLPNVARHLPADQLASLLAMTRVVGMEAPGLHSILAGLELRDSRTVLGPGDVPQLHYETENYDDRVSRLELHVAGPGLAGKVTAFVRPEPQKQSTFATLRSIVSPDEFRGEKALVVGGSRGLGEVAVKLLAAGGADVKFTYHRGAADAERVTSEIAAGGAPAGSFAYDVLTDPAQLSALVGSWSPTLLCYFATPFISAVADRRFSVSRFEEFCSYYVGAFLNTFHAARGLGPYLNRVLYPSSAFVDEIPLNMGEYAAAKSAAETLCRFLAKSHGDIRFHCPRLPRLATDQTASLIRTDLPDPAPALLAALREMRAK
jgi:NAD(P)-dependent dehydrogenase (short-subunit alcohol dehydrogenase family)